MSASPSPFPANTCRRSSATCARTASVTRGWLGVQIQPVTEDIAESLGIDETEGAIVADAQADGPAAGRRHQDRRHHHQGERQRGEGPEGAFARRSPSIEPGQKITVTVMRDGSEQDINVTLGNLNDFDKQQQAATTSRSDPTQPTQSGSLDGARPDARAEPRRRRRRGRERRRGQPGGRQGPAGRRRHRRDRLARR